MFDISSGAFWMVITVIGVALLGAALAWGAARTARRDPRQDALTEAATRQQYDHPNAGDKSASPDRERPLSPSR
ncbi:MAG: hypothetical protein ABW042_04265 [Phenylobacterium sp.]